MVIWTKSLAAGDVGHPKESKYGRLALIGDIRNYQVNRNLKNANIYQTSPSPICSFVGNRKFLAGCLLVLITNAIRDPLVLCLFEGALIGLLALLEDILLDPVDSWDKCKRVLNYADQKENTPLSRASSLCSLSFPPPAMLLSLPISPPPDEDVSCVCVWTGLFFSESVSLLTKSILVEIVTGKKLDCSTVVRESAMNIYRGWAVM